MRSLPGVSSIPASTTVLPRSQEGVDHDRNCCADCGSRGRTLLSCPCSICHLLVAIYTALIAGAGWAGGNGNVWEPRRHGAEKRKILLGLNVPDWAWEGAATCHSTGTALQAQRLCRPTAFQWHSESLKKITACAEKLQIPPGLSSRALIAACFIQPVSPVLFVVLYMFSIFKACFSWQCFFWHFHTRFFFLRVSPFQKRCGFVHCSPMAGKSLGVH